MSTVFVKSYIEFFLILKITVFIFLRIEKGFLFLEPLGGLRHTTALGNGDTKVDLAALPPER